MTNEDIEKKAQEVYDNIGPDFGQTIAQGMRELVLQAYEEAIEIAKCERGKHSDYAQNTGDSGARGAEDAASEIEEQIQVLKDSLAEKVSA